MKNLHTICKRVLKITDAELDAAEAEAQRQVGYTHPLRMGHAQRVVQAGRHNLRVISALRLLKKEIAGQEWPTPTTPGTAQASCRKLVSDIRASSDDGAEQLAREFMEHVIGQTQAVVSKLKLPPDDLKRSREIVAELLLLRKNAEGQIGWRSPKRAEAVVDEIRAKHIWLIEELEKILNP